MRTKAKKRSLTCLVRELIIFSMLFFAGFTGGMVSIGETRAANGAFGETAPKGITIQAELIETEHSTLSTLLFERDFKTDSGDLRKQIQKQVKAGEADIIETVIIRTKDGMRTDTLSADGISSPQYYDEIGAAKFEVQNAGVSFKVDPMITEEGTTILLNSITLEYSEKIADADYGQNAKSVKVTQSQFHKARIETTVVVKDGAYAFVGTVRLHHPHNKDRKDPIVMVFLRAMINQTDGIKKSDGAE